MRLEVRGLSYSFGDKSVLKEVSFDVEPGEFMGLMGPNGSGKTTLLRCMMNYLSPPADAISIDGAAIESLTPDKIARTFAVVPQSSLTDFTFSAYDIVMMGRLPHRRSRFAGPSKADADAVRSAMERTGTWKLSGRPFFALSGGERQRVIIARAVAQHPEALLLDEPTVYLDINGQLEVMDLIKSLNREEGITVISVLHDVNLAARYCDRIALLSEGWLEAVGPPRDVLNPEVIRSVYGVDVVVRRDPFTNNVYVVPHLSGARVPRHGRRVHVLCGGGVGGPVMKALLDAGYDVSTGVLNVLDSDFENAKDLRIPTVAEVPFAQIGDEAHAENMRVMSDAGCVIVAPFPVGPGNFRNLEAARQALEHGKSVFVVRDKGADIDFVGGRANKFISELIDSGAVAVDGLSELLSILPKEDGT